MSTIRRFISPVVKLSVSLLFWYINQQIIYDRKSEIKHNRSYSLFHGSNIFTRQSILQIKDAYVLNQY